MTTTDLELTVVDWNVDGWHTIRDAQLDLIDGYAPDVLLLQEVTPASLERLRSRGWEGTTAQELLLADHEERDGVRPRFSCAILSRGRSIVEQPRLVDGAPSPVRALAADVTVDGVRLHAVSAALPPGSAWGRRAKTGQAGALSQHLQEVDGPRVLGMDRNGPRFEGWAWEATTWWREDDPAFFDRDAAHGLTDVLWRHYDARSDVREAAREARPDGPLEISYVEQRATPPVPRRYDVIMGSDDWAVRDVAYDYPAATAAGSDHALVMARLSRRHLEPPRGTP